MKKKLIFIQLCIVLILFCINVKGQNASLNKALEISYYNFLRTVPDRWKDKFDRKDFYLVNNYNPYGFNVQTYNRKESCRISAFTNDRQGYTANRDRADLLQTR